MSYRFFAKGLLLLLCLKLQKPVGVIVVIIYDLLYDDILYCFLERECRYTIRVDDEDVGDADINHGHCDLTIIKMPFVNKKMAFSNKLKEAQRGGDKVRILRMSNAFIDAMFVTRKKKAAEQNPMTLSLNELELGVIGSIIVMICKMWDVHAAIGRYLSINFIMSDTHKFTIVPNKDEFCVIRFADFMLEFNGETTTRKAFLKSKGFTRYPFQLLEINDLEPRNNKCLIDVVGYVTNVALDSPLAYRLYLSSTSSTLIVDDVKIPLLMWLKTNDSGVVLTKEILPVDNTKLKSATFLCEVKIDKVRTKKVWNYPSCEGDKCKKGNLDCKDGRFWCDSCNNLGDYPAIRLELEISDETSEAVDEEAFLGLPAALANIMGISHTLEFKSHTYYEHINYDSFTCWKVVTCKDVQEGASSTTVAANDASKAPEFKILNKTLAVATPSKSGEEKRRRREELKDSDAGASFVKDIQPKEGDVACSSDTRLRKRVVLDDLE
nr:hypothetical protein [Tanacetum cinerariifolium]